MEEIKKEFYKTWYLWNQDKDKNMITCGEEVWFFIEKVYKLGEENGIDNTKEEARKRIIELLKRIKLEFDVCICDCGAEWKDTDGAELVNSMIEDLGGLDKAKDK